MRRDFPSPYSLENLRAMKAPQVFTKETDVLVKKYVTLFEEKARKKLYPMQIEMLLIETLAYAMSLLGEEAQMVAEQHLVAFASGSHLDLLGGNRSTPRLKASTATCMIEFKAEFAFKRPVVIPSNTRVAMENYDNSTNSIVFKTINDVVLPAGVMSIEVEAIAERAGLYANGFNIGTINTILDILPQFSASNTTLSEGGADVEEDDAYRLREANAFERISRAGPREAYREAVMRISPAILDCAVVRPQPCYIDIYVLTNLGTAGTKLKSDVLKALDEEVMRPMGDLVTMKDCVSAELSPVVLVRVHGGATVIEPLVRVKLRAIIADWETRLGAELAPSDLIDAAKTVAGVIDVEVSNFTYAQLAAFFYAKLGTLTINMVVLP